MGTSRFIERLECRRLFAAQLVKDLAPGTADTNPKHLTVVGNELFFSGSSEEGLNGVLYRSDGTAAGTVGLASFIDRPELLTSFGGRLYFAAPAPGGGECLWTSDGTSKGTVIVENLHGGADSGVKDIAVAGGSMYCLVARSAYGDELWKSDGSARGTKVVATLPEAIHLVAAGSHLFFTEVGDSRDGVSLWTSDGTAAGTQQVTGFEQIQDLVPVGNRVFFSVIGGIYDPSAPKGVWVSDGTPGGTHQVIQSGQNGLSDIVKMQAVGPLVYFVDAKTQLWRTDGTTAGTVLIKRLDSTGMDNIFINEMADFDGGVFFGANLVSVVSRRNELWRSFGKPGNTQQISNINPAGEADPRNFTPIGDTLFFTATDPGGARGLWATDGTSVVRVTPSASISDFNEGGALMTVMGSDLFYGNDTHARGDELWKINVADVPGNLAGTLFNDADADGVQAAGESAARGRTVYIDANNNAQLDAGELSAMTSSTGRFQFNELPPGKYRVRVVPASGLIAESAPRMQVTSFATKTIHIGVVPSANIRGVVFNDANHNGVFDNGESGIADARLYLDANGNHAFDAGERNVHADSDGKFEFDDLLPGTDALRASAILGLIWTTPIARTTTLAVGGSATRNFGGYFT